MNVRKAKLGDTRRIAEIHVSSWQAVYKDSFPSDYLAKLDISQRESMWRSCINKNGQLYVAENDQSEIVGFLNIATAQDIDLPEATELTAIYFDPRFFGSGIGTIFWREIEKDISTDCVYLWVLATNLIGIAFYEKNGFKPDGESKNIEIGGQKFEALRYLKSLRHQPEQAKPAT